MSVFAKKITCLFLLIAAIGHLANAQVTPYAFSHITLYNNQYARTLMRDSKGYLWIGSDGLFRFDGISTRRFTHDPKNNNSLVNDIVKSLVEDKKGRIWIGTIKGISRYDPATDSFTNYEPDAGNAKHPETHLDNILFIDRDSVLWSGDKEGISRFDEANNRFIYYDLEKYQQPGHHKGNFITRIIDDKKNNGWLWLSSYDGLVHFNKKTGSAKYYYPPGPLLTLTSLLEDTRGRLWVGTWGSGLGLFDEAQGRFSFFMFEGRTHLGSDNIIFNMQEAIAGKDSNLFLLCTNKGLTVLDLHDPAAIKYRFFYIHQPDDKKSIGGIALETLTDKQGIIWVATGNDVSYILPATQPFRRVNSTNIPDAQIGNIVEEKLPGGSARYWLSCWYAGGLVACDENFLPEKVKLPAGYGTTANSKQVNQVLIDSITNSMWIATLDGLYQCDRSHNTIKTFRPGDAGRSGLPSEQVMCILIDHQKRLWIGTYKNGISLLNTGNDSFLKLPQPIIAAFNNKRVFCIFEDSRQRIWVGSSMGLLRMDEKDGTWQIYQHQKDNIRSKAAGNVNGIVEDKNGTIWIGNDEGLNRYNEKANDFDLFTMADGLSNDHVYSMVCDRSGMLWIGTSGGLNALNPATRSIKSFYEKDGLLSNDVSNALFIKSNNEMVAAGTGGYVTIFDPAKMYRNTAPPPVYITSLRLFNNSDKRSPFPLPREVHLSYDENYFSIDFIALNLMNATDNKYAYQLTGLDKNWLPGGAEHTATYSNLGAGRYVFRVKASNNDGVWNRQGASLVIIISPPFWKTWWFIALCIIAALAIVYSIYSYRLEQLLRVERLRTKISTDLHDDIGSTLSSISILSELVLHKKNRAQADEMLNEIKDNAINLMEKMDDIVWSINPRNDSLEDLLSRITRFAANLFEAKDIDHTITIPPDIKELKLSMEARQHMYLMIKESINNIIKHAGCSTASISATYTAHLLQIIISDNGRGFDTPGNGSGNGLMNLRERAGKMGAVVGINSSPGKGTTVTIGIKIK